MNNFKYEDADWKSEQWKNLLSDLVNKDIVTWKEIASLTLGHLNPSQVGTSMASSEGFKKRYGKGNTMRIVMDWFYSQIGQCADCGTRLELQADHSKPKETFNDPLDADYIENMVLRCRRCNVIKRPSHVFGGQTHLTAEAALMWLLLTFKPRTLKDFIRLCRLYGMTMADIRMQEGWAMAQWLHRSPKFDYQIDYVDSISNVVSWCDGAITRYWKGDIVSGYQDLIGTGKSFCDVLAVASSQNELLLFRIPISELPFSHYFTGTKSPPQSLAVRYRAPRRGTSTQAAEIIPEPPRGMKLHYATVVDRDDATPLRISDSRGMSFTEVLAPCKGKSIKWPIRLPAKFNAFADGKLKVEKL